MHITFRRIRSRALYISISSILAMQLAACDNKPAQSQPGDAGATDGALSNDANETSDGAFHADSAHQDAELADLSTANTDARTQNDASGTSQSGGRCAEISTAIRSATGHTIIVSPADNDLVSVDGQTKSLRQVVSDASAGDTILLEDGTYTFAESDGSNYTGLYFTTPNITLRSRSGHAQDVILDSDYADHGGESALVTIAATGIVIADLTLQRSIFHLVHFWSDGDSGQIHNVRLIDGGQQFVKSSPGNGESVDDVKITCSDFIMTASGRDNVWGYGSQTGSTRCYTGGIDTHGSRNWYVANNRFNGIYCNADGVQRPVHGKKAALRDNLTYTGGLAEYAIHMWDSPSGSRHVLERNLIIDCARGIGFGMADDFYGGVIRNNMIFSQHAASSEHDVAISVERGHNVSILNNSVFLSSPEAYNNSIEYRWAVSSGLTISNNLTNKIIRSRNDAQAQLSSNFSDANASMFVDANNGNLHLAQCNNSNIDGMGTSMEDVVDDFDEEVRGDSNDIGADQCRQ